MNCQKGDIAIIIKSTAGNEGISIVCEELIGYPVGFTKEAGQFWRVDKKLRTNIGRYEPYVPDSFLMPIGKKQHQKEAQKEKPIEA